MRRASSLAFVLIDDSSVRETRLASLLADDAALALWAVCVARMASLSAHTVTGLARWLSPHLLAVLNWDPEGVAPRMRDLESRWRELAVDSVAIAHLAANSTEHDPEPAEAYLAGLLYNSPEWLRSCGPRPSLNGTAPTCLPPWLIEQLADRGRATAVGWGNVSKTPSRSGDRPIIASTALERSICGLSEECGDVGRTGPVLDTPEPL